MDCVILRGGQPLGTPPTNGALLPQEPINGRGGSVSDREPANSTALPQDQRVNRLFTEVAEALSCARAVRNSQVQQVQCEPQHPQLFHQLRQPSQVLPVNHQKPAQGQPETEHGPDKSSNVPWLARQVVDARCAALGLHEGRIAKFAESCEFVSLGSYCAVARALQSLDLKRYSSDTLTEHIIEPSVRLFLFRTTLLFFCAPKSIAQVQAHFFFVCRVRVMCVVSWSVCGLVVCVRPLISARPSTVPTPFPSPSSSHSQIQCPSHKKLPNGFPNTCCKIFVGLTRTVALHISVCLKVHNIPSSLNVITALFGRARKSQFSM